MVKQLVTLLLISALASPADARVEGYPYLDNETLGMFNILRDALSGEVGKFDTRYWGDPGLEKNFGGMLGLTRYLVAGPDQMSGHGVAHGAETEKGYGLLHDNACFCRGRLFLGQNCCRLGPGGFAFSAIRSRSL